MHSPPPIAGKGKKIMEDTNVNTPIGVHRISYMESSSSDMKLFVNRFANAKPILVAKGDLVVQRIAARPSSICDISAKNCRKIGHLVDACNVLMNGEVNKDMGKAPEQSKDVERSRDIDIKEDSSYGPWLLVNNRRNKRQKVGYLKKEFVSKFEGVFKARFDNALLSKPIKTTTTEEMVVPLSGEKALNEANRLSKDISPITDVVLNAPVDEDGLAIFSEGDLLDSKGDRFIGLGNVVAGGHKPKLAKELRSLGPLKSSSKQSKMNGVNKKEASLYLKEFVREWDILFVGGILVLWRSSLASFTLLEALAQCVVGELKIFNKRLWVVSTVYSSRDLYGRRRLWDYLEQHSRSEIPYVVGGDFNCILSQDDKKGGKKFSFSKGPLEMKGFMNKSDLYDIVILEPKYTWCNKKNGTVHIHARLDRCLLNSEALELIRQASIRHPSRVASNHYPIVLKIFMQTDCSRRNWRFEDVWLSYPTAASVVSRSWSQWATGNAIDSLNKKFSRTLKDVLSVEGDYGDSYY
ncbi:uncharacterized protein LOC110093946 [Dendrobium catenatum]|uniref:uncharacterized protein LOC110093946 n=1 Tax=Dendrobium catenatum TaxID=906689 RepID=UPI0009F4289E|nr:uncharacterized protein LOC110093946 [Dendrobium catenatum]